MQRPRDESASGLFLFTQILSVNFSEEKETTAEVLPSDPGWAAFPIDWIH